MAVGLHLLLCLATFDPKLHTGGDNAAYILLAESILRAGDGYSLGMNPGPPLAHVNYPFGFPLLLAPLLALFGRSVILFKMYSVAFSAGSVLLFALLARRMVPPLVWVALIAAVAVNPVLIEYSHWILSESPFLFFSLLALYLMIREREQTHRPGRSAFFAGGAVCSSLTVLIRTAGIALPLGVIASLLLGRRWRAAALFTLITAAMLGPWIVRNNTVRGDQAMSYEQQLLMKNPYRPHLGMLGPADLAARVRDNARIYFLGQQARVLLRTEVLAGFGKGGALLAGLLSLLVLTGLGLGLLRRRGVVDFYVLATLGVVLVWPSVWSDVRFIMAVIPLFLLYIAESMLALAALAGFTQPGRGKVAAVALAVFAAGSLLSQLPVVRANLHLLARYTAGERYAGYGVNFRQFFECADWVRENTDEDAVVTVRKPRLFHYLSGRKVLNYPYSLDADSVLAVVLRTDYVVIDAVSGTTGRYLVPALQKQPGSFKLVYDERYAKVAEVLK